MYAANFILDCTGGLIVSMILIKVLECWANRQAVGSWARQVIR
jgi:hypothetical protein